MMISFDFLLEIEIAIFASDRSAFPFDGNLEFISKKDSHLHISGPKHDIKAIEGCISLVFRREIQWHQSQLDQMNGLAKKPKSMQQCPSWVDPHESFRQPVLPATSKRCTFILVPKLHQFSPC